MKTHELINNSRQKQYEFDIDGLIAKIQYKTDGDKIYLLHTEVPEELEGKGIASELVKQTLKDIEQNNMKLVPRCAFVGAYLERHPEWKKLVAEER